MLIPSLSRNNLKKIVELLKKGEVIICPTDTVYGLFVNVFCPAGIKRIYQLKGRSWRKPLILMGRDIKSMEQIVVFDSLARKLAKKFWPGPLTIILPTTHLGKMISGGRLNLGVRIPDCPVLQKILQTLDFPLFSTSANPSGYPATADLSTVVKYFGKKVSGIVGVKSKSSGIPSTVIDISCFPYQIIREGGISKKMLASVLKVC